MIHKSQSNNQSAREGNYSSRVIVISRVIALVHSSRSSSKNKSRRRNINGHRPVRAKTKLVLPVVSTDRVMNW